MSSADWDEARIASALDLYPKLLRLARSLTLTREDAEDVTQQTYLNILPHLSSLDDSDGAVPRYCYRALRNTFRDFYRRSRLRHALPLPSGWDGELAGDRRAEPPPPSLVTHPPHEVIYLRDVLQSIPDVQAQALLAVGYYGFTFKEHAAQCGTTTSTIWGRWERGVRNVQQRY